MTIGEITQLDPALMTHTFDTQPSQSQLWDTSIDSSQQQTSQICVRTLGRLVEYDLGQGHMLLEHKSTQLLVGTHQCSTDIDYHLNGQYQVLGELEWIGDRWILRARICHRVDGLDMAMFERMVIDTAKCTILTGT